jgi:hypothetical protein
MGFNSGAVLRVGARWIRRALVLERAAVGLVLVAAMVQAPRPPGSSLDPSYRIVLGRSFAEGAQFGTERIYTYGPLGFLMLRTYDGVHFVSLLAWQLAIAMALAAVVIHSGRRLAPLRRILYYGVFVLFGTLADSASYLILAGLLGFQLVREEESERSRVAACLLLALLAAVKFTHLVLAAVFVAIACALALHEGRPRRAAALAGGFAGGFVAIWLLCGQDLANLGDYLAASLEVSRGYEDSMGRAAEPASLVAAFAVLVALAAYGALHLAGSWRRAQVLAATGILAAYVFVTGKYGFVRAGGHMIFFFLCALLPAAGFPTLLEDGARLRLPKQAMLGIAAIGCLVGIYTRQPELLMHPVAVLMHRLQALPLDPSLLRRQLDDDWERQRERFDLPRTRAVLGPAPVDVLGFEQAVGYFNGFALRLRPVFQSYLAYTPELARRNEQFYLSARAPDFVLAKVETIDGRPPMVDDSLAWRVMLDEYHWVHSERGFSLWRRALARPAPPRGVPLPIRTEAANFGQRIELGELAERSVWATLRWRPSRLGTLRTLLYKPPAASLTLEDMDGVSVRYRLPRLQAMTGFQLNPWIDDDRALERYATGGPVRRVRAFAVAFAPGDERFVEGPIEISFFELSARGALPR